MKKLYSVLYSQERTTGKKMNGINEKFITTLSFKQVTHATTGKTNMQTTCSFTVYSVQFMIYNIP